jgi:hypothetical protein
MKQRRAYPKEPKHQMTEAWKQQVRDALAQREDGVTWLARMSGVNHATIVKALDPKRRQRTSSAVPAICKVLGISPPLRDESASKPADSDEQTLLDKFRRLGDREKGKLIGYASALEASPEKGD